MKWYCHSKKKLAQGSSDPERLEPFIAPSSEHQHFASLIQHHQTHPTPGATTVDLKSQSNLSTVPSSGPSHWHMQSDSGSGLAGATTEELVDLLNSRLQSGCVNNANWGGSEAPPEYGTQTFPVIAHKGH